MNEKVDPPPSPEIAAPLFPRLFAARKFDNFPALHFLLGTKSADDRAILGQDGYVFLYQGSNRLLDLYAMPKGPAKQYVASWDKLLRERTEQLAARGVRYFSFIIPEKSTVMPEKFPFRIAAPSPPYAEIDKTFGDRSVISTFELFRNSSDRLLLFPKTDSHLSVLGCLVLFRHLLPRCFPDVDPGVLAMLDDQNLLADEPDIMPGPLAQMLFNVPIYEEFLSVRKDAFAAFGEGELIAEADAAPGKHLGTRRVWRNPNAPIKAKVVAFGNSFMERGVTALGLSWWFKRFVSEFHFVWQFNIDYDYIDAVKPDTVLFQSIERFLTVVPAT